MRCLIWSMWLFGYDDGVLGTWFGGSRALNGLLGLNVRRVLYFGPDLPHTVSWSALSAPKVC